MKRQEDTERSVMEGGKQLIQGSACSASRRTQDVTMPVEAALSWKPNKEGLETGRFLKLTGQPAKPHHLVSSLVRGPVLKQYESGDDKGGFFLPPL